MKWRAAERPQWKSLLERERPLILPAAHDALTAKIIERAGFPAYQIGGFALSGARHAFPDIDLTHFGDESAGARDIVEACSLPVLIDADDGYGDVKNVARTILGYEALGASAIFIEDQRGPKRCGHMSGKEVVPAEVMEGKVRAAVAARRHDHTFILARTDAIEPLGLDEALRRAELYLKAGADGVYVEGPTTVEELDRIGRAFAGQPLATSILEGGGKTPWLPPHELYKLGFSMILYPTSILFRATRAIERAVLDLTEGRPMPSDDAVDFARFETIVDLAFWKDIETKYHQR
jgi:2-methylisocitrate lyase-like PEP mutase family enzyme